MRSASSIGVAPARDRAADRAGLDAPALDPHVHLRRGRDEEFAVAEIDQRAVRRRVGLAQPVEDERSAGRRTASANSWPGTTSNRSPRMNASLAGATSAAYSPGPWSLSGGVVRRDRDDRAPAGSRAAARRRSAGDRELVAMDRRVLAHVVDDQDLVGQVQHEVALVGGARQPEPHRLELEHQVVAERAVEPEMLVLRTGEQVDQARAAPRRRSAGGCAVPRESGRCCRGSRPRCGPRRYGASRPRRGRQSRRHRSEQQAPALVERLDRELAAARGQHQRRVDKPHVPARIAAGKLEARRKQHAALMVEPVGQRRVGRAIGLRNDLALDADAALGLVADALHEVPSGNWSPRRSLEPSRENAKAARCSEAACKKRNRWPPGLDGPPPID